MAAALRICEEDGASSYLEKAMKKEWKTFHKTLAAFPHSFQLEDAAQLSKTTCLKLINALLSDHNFGLSTPLETARTLNLLGYFYFLLGDSREALCRIEQSLAEPGEERNLVSQGNRAAIQWKLGNRDKAREHVKALEELKGDSDFHYLAVRAQAELAFSYTRLGGHCSPKAVALFTEVISKARPPELWLWKFGLALTQRRMVHMHSAPVLANTGEQEQTLVAALDALQDVIKNSGCNSLKAKCYSEIANLLQGRRGSKSQTFFENKAKLTPVKACEKALELDSDDCSVQWKCARIFRYAKRLDQSVELLKKSVEQRPTTAEYHHLGLTFLALARRAKGSERGEVSERGRGGHRNQRGQFWDSRRARGESRGRVDSGSSRGERGRSGFRGGRGQYREFSNVQSQGWNVNRGRHSRQSSNGRWMTNANRRGDAREPQYNSSTNRSEFSPSSYSQLCSRGRRDRMRTNQNTAEHFLQQEAATDDSTAEEQVSTRGAHTVTEPELTEGNRPGQRHAEEQTMGCEGAAEPDQLALDFSGLTLNADDIALADSNQHSSTRFLGHGSNWVSSRPATSPQAASDRGVGTASQREIHSLRKVIKSPARGSDQFVRSDAFVQQALDAFQKSISFSENENVRAVYDLALMHKALGEFDEAVRLLDLIILDSNKSTGLLDKINAHEQTGLIKKEMSMMESDLKNRKDLNEEGESQLNTALRLSSRLCNKLPSLQNYIQHVWHAFPTLFQAAEESGRDTTDKLYKQARLLSMIKSHRHSTALLQQISRIDPERAKDPGYLKMCIENYIEEGLFDEALTFMEMLTCTSQQSTMDFGDRQCLYMKAGRAALLSGGASHLKRANDYFSDTFIDAFRESHDETSSSDDTKSMDELFGEESWDIMLLHEKSADSKSEALANIFEKAFGLKVTGMFEDCLPGTFRGDSFYWVMKRSKLVVVLAGRQRLSSDLRALVRKAAVNRPTTVALLVEGSHVPAAIKGMADRETHHMVCPEELLREENQIADGGSFPPQLVEKACEVFSFFVDIPLH